MENNGLPSLDRNVKMFKDFNRSEYSGGTGQRSSEHEVLCVDLCVTFFQNLPK